MALERSRALLLAGLIALPIGVRAQLLYVCTTPNGRTLTGDMPPPECQNVQIRELNRDGSVRRVIDPPLTSEQKKAREADEKARRERERAAQEQLRKDRALLEAYAGEDEIEAARYRVLAERQTLIQRANQQLKEYKADRKRLDDEAEFYAKRPMPEKLKRALAENTALQDRQLHQIEEIRADMERVNEHYDADLNRYRELVQRGATPVQRKTSP